MMADKKHQSFGVAFIQVKNLCCFLGQSSPNNTVIFLEHFANIMKQKRKVQHLLVLDALVASSQDIVSILIMSRRLNNANRMFINGVFMLFVELNEAPNFCKRRNNFFQHTHFVQTPQKIPQTISVRHE